MKLLLTSNGVCNKTLRDALKKLVNDEVRVAFIPTAANIVEGSKYWLINDLTNFQKVGEVDIVDISAVERSVWLPRIKEANVIVFGGGNSAHLMECISASGLDKELEELLKTRIYVGISAGSIATAKTLHASSDFIYDEPRKIIPKGLGFVDFNIRPHLNSPDFPHVTDENLSKVSKDLVGDTYVIDDETGIQVVDGKISIVTEGKWLKCKGK